MSMRRHIATASVLLVCLIVAISSHSGDTTTESVESTANPVVLITTSVGDILLQLDQQRAPQTVENFLQYVDSGFYSQTLFHRVIEGFMIQGGGFTESYQRKATRAPVSNEAYNGLRNKRYTIAMARTTAPHSATSQFFINSEDNRNLDHTATTQRGWGYTVFGRVVQGTETVDTISRLPTGRGGPFSRDVPKEPVIIVSIERVAPAEQSNKGTAVQSDSGESSAIEEPEPAAAKAEAKIQ